MSARNHHYIPQYYLRGFTAGRQGRLHTIDLKQRKAFFTSTRNVAARRDFNRIDAKSYDPAALERSMAQFESECSAALARICAAKHFCDADDRSYIFNLICLLVLRNPEFRSNIAEFHKRVAKGLMDIVVSSPNRWKSAMKSLQSSKSASSVPTVTYEEMKSFIKDEEYELKVDRTYLIGLEFSTFEKSLETIFGRKWTLYRAAKGSGGFATTDHPAHLMWTDVAATKGPYSPGLGLFGTTLVFPLNSELCLLGEFEGRDEEVDANFELVALLNGVVVGSARQQIYSEDGTFYWGGSNGSLPSIGLDLLKRIAPQGGS